MDGASIRRKFEKKVLEFIEKGHKKVAACCLFGLSKATVFRWLRLKKETGNLKPQVRKNKPRKINYEQLQALVKAHPDYTLAEFARHFNMSSGGLRSAMVRLKLTRKKRVGITKALRKKSDKDSSQ